MASQKNIVINEEHIAKITSQFDSCAELASDIKKEVNNLQEIISYSYVGAGKAGAEESLSILFKHLELLELSYKQLSKFSEYAKVELKEMDKNLFQKVKQILGGY